METHGISSTTAKRDLAAIREQIPEADFEKAIKLAVEKQLENIMASIPTGMTPKELTDFLKLQHSPKQSVEVSSDVTFTWDVLERPPPNTKEDE